MRKSTRRTSGRVLAQRVCREIIRCGYATMLGARYVPELQAVRVGVPTRNGMLDAAIDYPCEEPRMIERFIAKLRRSSARHLHEQHG